MSTAIITVIGSGVSAVVGGLIVARSNLGISRRQAADIRHGGLRETLIALISAVMQVDGELRAEPRSKRTVRVVNEQVATRFPQIDYLTGRLHRRLFQPQLDSLSTRLHDALAATILDSPPELLPVLQRLTETMSRVDQNSDAWWRSWDEVRDDLVIACRDVLGQPVLAAQTRVAAA